MGLFDDEDDIDTWLALKAGQSDVDVPEAVQPEAAAPKDDTLEEFLKLRQGALARPTSTVEPVEHSVDLTGGIGAIGALLGDAVLNKGRGAPQIAGAAAQNYSQAVDKAGQMNQRERELQLQYGNSRKNDPLEEYLAYSNLKARQKGLELAGRGRTVQETTLESKIDPNSAEGRGRAAQVGNESSARTAGRIQTTHDFAPTTTADAAARARAVGDESVETAVEREKQTGPLKTAEAANRERALLQPRTATAAATSGARVQAGLDVNSEEGNLDKAAAAAGARARGTATGKETAEREAAANPVKQIGIPGSHVLDEAVFNTSTTDPTRREHVAKIVQKLQMGIGAMEQMRDIRARAGADFKTGDNAGYDSARMMAGGAFSELAQLGVLQPSDWKAIESALPQSGVDGTDVWDAVSNFRNPFDANPEQDVKLSQINGLLETARGNANRGLKTYGLGFGDGPNPVSRATAPVAPQARMQEPSAVSEPSVGDEEGNVDIRVMDGEGKPVKGKQGTVTTKQYQQIKRNAAARGWTVETF